MTKEEFTKKYESDESLRKAYEADPMKVLQDNNVELSGEDLVIITGGVVDGGCNPGWPPKPFSGNKSGGDKINISLPGQDGLLPPAEIV